MTDDMRVRGEQYATKAAASSGASASGDPVVQALLGIYWELRHQADGDTYSIGAMRTLAGALEDHSTALHTSRPRD